MKIALDRLRMASSDWIAPELPENIPHGDMPGDKICVSASHQLKAETILRCLAETMADRLSAQGRMVLSVSGGSGVGKSEVASVLGYNLAALGIGAYILSGDNYPRRIPAQNDAERLRVFRVGGVKALLADGRYSAEVRRRLHELWLADQDADPALCGDDPWLTCYQAGGSAALAGYLGSAREIDFDEINGLIQGFKAGEPTLWCKRMGRAPTELWYDSVDMRACQVLIVEWTHGNSPLLRGIDLPVVLASTPRETLEHRRARGRDGKVDSAFTTMVLNLEQAQISAQIAKAALILAKSGQLMTPEAYARSMNER